ncbi:MarR family transcriptional regulator [Mycolicibacillus trivialis]
MADSLSTTEERTWGPYIEASLRLETRLDERLRASAGIGLMDYHVLRVLAHAPRGRLRMSELAEQMVFSRSRTTYQITAMAKRGWVLREPVPEDGRGYRAVLTASGVEVLRRALPRHVASLRELFFDHIRPDELGTIERVFTRVRAHLQTHD